MASWEVAEEFANNFLALGGAIERPGGPALFDAALTTALVVLVTEQWPDEVELKPAKSKPGMPHMLKSASQLLEVISRQAQGVGDGVYVVPVRGVDVCVDVNTLRRAVARLGATRHGKGGSGIIHPDEHRALERISRHPTLAAAVRGKEADSYEYEAIGADADEQVRAASYLELLTEDEIDRRASCAEDTLPGDPKERSEAWPLLLCPVCERETFVATSIDDLGIGIGVGSCFLCSYRRDGVVALLDARHEAYVNYMARDD